MRSFMQNNSNPNRQVKPNPDPWLQINRMMLKQAAARAKLQLHLLARAVDHASQAMSRLKDRADQNEVPADLTRNQLWLKYYLSKSLFYGCRLHGR